MLQTTSFARQGRLAADYRVADYRAADVHRAEKDATRSAIATLDDTGTPRSVIRPIARLLTLLPHAR